MVSTRTTTVTATAALAVAAAAVIGATAGSVFPSPATPDRLTSVVAAGAETGPTPTGTPTPTTYLLPPVPTVAQTLLGTALPTPAFAKSRLVNGYPAALAPPAGMTIESSSVSVHSGVVQVALVATGGDANTVMTYLRRALTSRGFKEQPAQGVENAPAVAFIRNKDNVTVTFLRGKTYLLANLRSKVATR